MIWRIVFYILLVMVTVFPLQNGVGKKLVTPAPQVRVIGEDQLARAGLLKIFCQPGSTFMTRPLNQARFQELPVWTTTGRELVAFLLLYQRIPGGIVRYSFPVTELPGEFTELRFSSAPNGYSCTARNDRGETKIIKSSSPILLTEADFLNQVGEGGQFILDQKIPD